MRALKHRPRPSLIAKLREREAKYYPPETQKSLIEEAQKDVTDRYAFHLPIELHERLKMRALISKQTMSEIITDLIREFLDR